MNVVHLRGTSGSGKSWLVYQLLHDPRLAWEEDVGPPLDPAIASDKPVLRGYRAPRSGIAIVGPYKTACGGCDAVPTQHEIGCRVFAAVIAGHHTVFEGLLASGLMSRYESMAGALQATGHTYHGLFLDTPLEVCLQRVQERRTARGDDRPLNPKNTVDKHRGMARAHDQLLAAGHRAEWVSADATGLTRVRTLLGLEAA